MKQGTFSGKIGPWGEVSESELDKLKPKFRDFQSADDEEGLDGLLVWESNDETQRVKLELLYHPDYGVSLVWMSKGLPIDYPEHHTVHDPSRLKREDWVDTGGQEWALIGSFLPIDHAWLVVEDFFANPTEPSPRANWIETRKLPRFPMQ